MVIRKCVPIALGRATGTIWLAKSARELPLLVNAPQY